MRTRPSLGKHFRSSQRIGVNRRISPTSVRSLKEAHSEALFFLWGEHV